MSMHLQKHGAPPRARPLAGPIVPTRDTSGRVFEAHEENQVETCRAKPSSPAKVRTEERDVAREERGCSKTQVLSLATLALAVTLLVQMGIATWAIEAYDWPRSWYNIEEWAQDMYFDRAFVQPGFGLLGLFLAAALLIGQESLVQRKDITLTVNVTATICILLYASLYIFNAFVILYDFTIKSMLPDATL